MRTSVAREIHMPSPFPGFDPFIEDQEWDDFQPSFNVVMSEMLAPELEPHYVARIATRRYIEHLPDPQERRETYLVIREVPSMEIVTVIETLSPANKRASSDGREQYLAKREEILQSRTNLVELDLLRGGKRLPVIGMPPATTSPSSVAATAAPAPTFSTGPSANRSPPFPSRSKKTSPKSSSTCKPSSPPSTTAPATNFR
jgi:hypothetical protein